MCKRLFTLVLDYAGGTYLSQRWASSPTEAVRDWLASESRQRAVGARTADALGAIDLTPVQGLSGTWCWSAEADGDLILMHVVETVQPSS